MELESLKMSTATDPSSSKGNSLFSEVEDRRTIVESQMSHLRAKYEEMKASYDAKVAQLHKVKMHNVALLNMASGAAGGAGGGQGGADVELSLIHI